jgi:hypothetical protein
MGPDPAEHGVRTIGVILKEAPRETTFSSKPGAD